MEFIRHVSDCQGIGVTGELALCGFVALCSAALRKPIQSQMTVLGNMSIGGTINKVEELANTLQVCFDAGAKKVLLPMSAAADIPTVPPELFVKFRHRFIQAPKTRFIRRWGLNN